MTGAQFVREVDRLEAAETPLALGGPDVSPLLGTWTNSNHVTWGIERLTVSRRDGRLWVRSQAATGDGGSQDWGEAPVDEVFTDGPRSGKACGFTASHDLGFMDSHVQTNMNHGLMIVAAFNVFKDGSGRRDYFSREFFFIEPS